MKRLSLVSILCFLLALVGLSSCGESTLRKDILGEWVGDPSTLKALEKMTDGEAKFHSFDFTFSDETKGVLNFEYTVSTKVDGEEMTLRIAFVAPITYKILGGRLSFKFDQAATRAEILEYLINGKECIEVLREAAEGKEEQFLQDTYEKMKREMEESVKEGMLEGFEEAGGEAFGKDLKVKDGIMTMKDEDQVLLSFHRKKS